MPSLPGTYENRGSDQLSQRHSKDSQLSGPTVAGAAHRRSRSNVFRSTGMVLKQRRVTLLWGVVCPLRPRLPSPTGHRTLLTPLKPIPGRAGLAIPPVAATAGH